MDEDINMNNEAGEEEEDEEEEEVEDVEEVEEGGGGGDEEWEEEEEEDEYDLDEVIESHPFLQERYPGLLPITLRDMRALEKAQEILIKVPGTEVDRYGGRVEHFSCEGRRLDDSIAIMDKITVLEVQGPGLTTLPAAMSYRYMPQIEDLALVFVPSADGFSVPRKTMKGLSIVNLVLGNSDGKIIRQFYPSHSISSIKVMDRDPLTFQVNSNKTFEGVLSAFKTDTDILSKTPLCRNLHDLDICADPVTIEQFCDITLMLTPDRFPRFNVLCFNQTGSITLDHIEGLTKILTDLIDDDKSYVPPRLEVLYLPKETDLLYTVSGLRSLLSLLEILDGVTTLGGIDKDRARLERRHPEYKKIFRRLFLHLNYTGKGFAKASPIAMKPASKEKQRDKNDAKDGDRSLKLSLWPRVIRLADTYIPEQDLEGGLFGHLDVGDTAAKLKELPVWHASTIFVLLKNGLAGNMDWHEYRQRNPTNATPAPQRSIAASNKKRRY